jgi:hypothetical protein
MALVTKAIKPKTLNVEGMMAALTKAANEVADEMVVDFAFTTATWKHQPKFERLVQVGPDQIAILVGTDDEIYGYVNDGTRPHPIYPKRAKRLRFQPVYTAKTVPGSMTSRAGGPSGPFVYSMGVQHPGTQPRNFDEKIEKETKPRFKSRMEQAMREARKASGHAI